MDDRVVVTGTGLVSSLGLSASETWDAVLSGKHGIKQIEDFDVQGFDCQVAALVPGLNPSVLDIHPRDARIMDKHSYMLMKCARDAFKQAGLDTALISSEDIGLFAGIGMVDYNIGDLIPAVKKSIDSQGHLDYDAFFSHGYQEIYPLWPLSMLNNISFCQVAIRLNIRGENTVFSPHADSGIQAITEAVNALIDKKAQAVIAGGVSEKVSPLSMARAGLHGILNTNSHFPPFVTGRASGSPLLKKGDEGGFSDDMLCRPFSSDRKGTVLGEGCGMLALELQSSAEKRRIPYTAMITGYGHAFEREDDSFNPTSKAIISSMNTAMEHAGIRPSDIDVIIAHADGTFSGDRNEIEAINLTFADCLHKTLVFSSKGALGHSHAGAPVIDIILGIHMLKHGIIPPTLHSLPLDKEVKFHLVNGKPLKTNLKRILINAGSYEGQCASLIIEAVN